MKRIVLLMVTSFSLFHVPTYSQLAFDHLLLDMPMDGNTLDFSGHQNHGTNHGAVLDTNRFGIPNTAYRFNGMDSYIEIPASPSLNRIQTSDVISISAWVNIFAWHSSGNVFSIFERYNPATDAGWLFEANWVGGGLLFLADENSPANWIGCNYDWDFHQWHHMGITYDQTLGLAKFYVDGVEICSKPYSYSINLADTTAPFVIGRSLAGPDEYSNGLIDDYKVYNRVLTPDEIELIFTSSRQKETQNSALSVNPNPIKDILTLQKDASAPGIDFVLFDGMGKAALAGKLESDKKDIQLKHLKAGIYFLRTPGKNGQLVKLMKE